MSRSIQSARRPSLWALGCALVVVAAGSACEIAPPFAGPGYDNGLVTDAEGPYFLAATHLVLPEGDGDTAAIFDERMAAINEAFDSQPGLIGSSKRTVLMGTDNWTVSVWESEEDAVAWVNHPAHVDAMSAMAGRAAGGTTAHWEVTAADLPPDWDAVKARLDSDGLDVY